MRRVSKMPGENNLSKLLANLSPALAEEEYVFCTFIDSSYGDFSELKPVASVMEKEGLSLVLEKKKAEMANIKFHSSFRCISLGIHSDLISIGLTAKISSTLCENGISSNIIAGYFHDHVFVPVGQAERALEVLSKLIK
jgi:hypothetical protein